MTARSALRFCTMIVVIDVICTDRQSGCRVIFFIVVGMHSVRVMILGTFRELFLRFVCG
jgi:hypothetical protein